MRSRVSTKGQTVVPLPIRTRHGIRARSELEWLDDGEVILVRPIPKDDGRRGQGRFKGLGLVKALLETRREDT